MPEADLNAWHIHYDDVGSGPPVLLAHGLLMDRTMFGPQVEKLKDRYRVITPDLRNHGESERRGEEHTQWDMMEDHIALADQLGIDKAVFGGVSQGGFQSLRAALKYPGRVAGLILIETQAGAEDEIRSPMYEAMSDLVQAEGYNPELLDTATISIFGSSASEELKETWKKRWQAGATNAAAYAMRAVTRRDDITSMLGEIEAPALVIHGEEDIAIEIEKAEILAGGLGNLVEFVRLPNAGHSSTIERPGEVNEAIERFLSKVWPPVT